MAKKDYSSSGNDYKTPPELYEKLLYFAGIVEFDLDVCCSEHNIPAKKYNDVFYTDGLNTDWIGDCFLNPPFNETAKWVKKAVESVDKYKTRTNVFAILPADRFETKYYQKYIINNPDCVFAFLPGKRGFIIPGHENEPVIPSQKIIIVIFTKVSEIFVEAWNSSNPFGTKAFIGIKD